MADDFIADYRIDGKRSLDKAERSVRHLARSFGGMRAREITTDRVRSFIQQRQKAGVSNAEINRELAALKRMFNLALRAERLFSKPYIPSLQENNVRTGFFEEEAFRAILAELPDSLKPVVLFDYYFGWRKKILRTPHRLTRPTAKNKRPRTSRRTNHPLGVPSSRRSDSRFSDGMGGGMSPSRATWTDYTRFPTHSGAEHGTGRIPERVAMMITGHKTRSVFDRYHIVSEGDLREAARKLSGKAALMGTIPGTIVGDAAQQGV